jgi:hypothetical protein
VELELAKSSGTSGVDGPLRDPLVVKVTDLLAVVKVLESCRTPCTRPQGNVGLLPGVSVSTAQSIGSVVRCAFSLQV